MMKRSHQMALAVAARLLADAGDWRALDALAGVFTARLSLGQLLRWPDGPPPEPDHTHLLGVFPYAETIPIRDARLSELCATAAKSGINGTAVYRRDDPVWREYQPPRHPNCRCGRMILTVHMAASRGIKEAEEWLRTGEAPSSPAWVTRPPVELPKGWKRPLRLARHGKEAK